MCSGLTPPSQTVRTCAGDILSLTLTIALALALALTVTVTLTLTLTCGPRREAASACALTIPVRGLGGRSAALGGPLKDRLVASKRLGPLPRR